MPEIQKLPDNLVEKIAAGEVVENPASVVKELIENSLDAGATTLDLSIERGGIRLIKLADDGSGIPRDQVRLAFARHATSKLSSLIDLESIGTFGFRGEALPSVAAVSVIEMTTGIEGAAEGTRILVEGGKEILFEPAPSRKGTVVTVKQLFFNTPARRKFLKTEMSETRKAVAVFCRYAAGDHDLTLRLTSDGKEILDFAADATLVERLERLWGNKVSANLIEIGGTPQQGLDMHGYITRPQVSRGNRNQIHIFVNGRPIYDVSLMHAIRSGYGNTLDSGFFPLAVVHIAIDKAEVDVNVHPAKSEVRFANEKYVYAQLKKMVEAAVQIPVLFSVHSVGDAASPGKPSVQDTMSPQAPHSSGGRVYAKDIMHQNFVGSGNPDNRSNIKPSQDHGHAFSDDTSTERLKSFETKSSGEMPADMPAQAEIEPELDLAGGKFWQLYSTFVMGYRDGKIWMIDQHTAHERILYEAALNNLCERPGISQRLLFDLTVELDSDDMAVFEHHRVLFERLGFEIEPFGNRAVIIRGVPAYFESSSVEKIFRNLLDGFSDSLSTGEDPVMALASSVACHAAVKAGETLTQEQMQGLFSRLFECQEPYQCPHGRPTVASISREDLERIFKRR